MKDREIQCVYYIYEGYCSIGREGTFRKKCQTCDKYIAKPRCRAARVNDKKGKLDKIKNKETKKMLNKGEW